MQISAHKVVCFYIPLPSGSHGQQVTGRQPWPEARCLSGAGAQRAPGFPVGICSFPHLTELKWLRMGGKQEGAVAEGLALGWAVPSALPGTVTHGPGAAAPRLPEDSRVPFLTDLTPKDCSALELLHKLLDTARCCPAMPCWTGSSGWNVGAGLWSHLAGIPSRGSRALLLLEAEAVCECPRSDRKP